MKVFCGLCEKNEVHMSKASKIKYKLLWKKECKTSHRIILCEQCIDENPLMSNEEDYV